MSATGSGFTLLELLVVLTLATLLVLALPLAANRVFPGQRLQAAADGLAADLRDLSALAALRSIPTAATLVDSGHGWTARPEERTTHFPGDMMGVLISATGLGASEIRFYPDGSSSGGVVTLKLDQRALQVRVSPMTGRVTVDRTS